MTYSVCVVGAGPTSIFCLQSLLQSRVLPAEITIFERQTRAGQGTPYSAHWSDPVMLANIASVEIPALPQSLVEWLRRKSDEGLAALGIDRSEIDERGFYPRLALGEYLADQFTSLVDRGRSLGVAIDVRTRCTVTDVRVIDPQIELTVSTARLVDQRFVFDYVILATGHQWPSDPEIRPGYFTSPWPATALERIRCCRVGIRGTSLSAIDAAVTLATHHGSFEGGGDRPMAYRPGRGTEDFSITMFSRKGILPEADFYHPIPYEPLSICTPDAISALTEQSEQTGLLDGAFELFRRELLASDSRYSQSLGLETSTLEEFGHRYFEKRLGVDPFAWASQNLEEARTNIQKAFTVRWRYAILRMHEVIEPIVAHLSDADFARFNKHWKPVFVDNYATVPHESIERLLCLHAEGKIVYPKVGESSPSERSGGKQWRSYKCRGFGDAFSGIYRSYRTAAIECEGLSVPVVEATGLHSRYFQCSERRRCTRDCGR